MKIEKYTEQFHTCRVVAILRMMKRTKTITNGCLAMHYCPAIKKLLIFNKYLEYNDPIKGLQDRHRGHGIHHKICCVCQEFASTDNSKGCPCSIVGEKENIQNSKIKLESMGIKI